jgi:hypothetical protein
MSGARLKRVKGTVGYRKRICMQCKGLMVSKVYGSPQEYIATKSSIQACGVGADGMLHDIDFQQCCTSILCSFVLLDCSLK